MPETKKTRLFIGGLQRRIEKEEMEPVFSPFGSIVEIWIAYDPPGYAFVEYTTEEEARTAMGTLHKTEQFGSQIRVEFPKQSKHKGAAEEEDKKLKPRLFVGDLKEVVEKEQLKAAFDRFGSISDIWIAHNPPGFAFVEFEQMNEAEDAIKEMHGVELFGGKIRVQLTTNRKASDRGGRGGGGRGMRGGGRPSPYYRHPPPAYDDYYDDPYRRPAPRGRFARDPYARDPYGAPPPRRMPPRDPYARDPYYADPYAAADPYADPYATRGRAPPPPPPGARRPEAYVAATDPYAAPDPYAAHDPYAAAPYPADPYAAAYAAPADPYAEVKPYSVDSSALAPAKPPAPEDPYAAMRGNAAPDPYAA